MNNICSAAAVIELASSINHKTREGVAKKWVKAQEEAFPPNIPGGLLCVYQEASYWGKLTMWAEFRLIGWGLGRSLFWYAYCKAAELNKQ